MAAAAPARPKPVKYSVHTDATNLFKFLTSTFSQMPKSVQIIGWFVFLLLFVYLVLYPMLGITYYEGKIMLWSLDPKTGKPIAPAPLPGITVKQGHSVVTNTDGEFTFAGRWPYIPFNSVDFWIEDPGVLGEQVSIPTPRPLVSMFNPNVQTIFFVPSSTRTDAGGLPQHYFLDSKSAKAALDQSIQANAPQVPPAHPASFTPAAPRSLLSNVYASSLISAGRNFTLRLREAKVSGIPSEAQVYLDIRIDGQPFHSSTIPDATSSESRDLTVIADTPLRLDSLYLPVPERAHRVDISMIERKSFLQRDPLIGTVSLDLDAKKTGIYPALRGGNLELTLELLPPASLRCVTVPGKAKNFIAAMWLDIAEEHLAEITRLQYDRGQNFGDVRYMTSSDPTAALDPFDHFADMISIFASQPVRATVDFSGGSKINLAAFCQAGANPAGSSMDSYYRASAYFGARDYAAALRENAIALQANPSRAQPHYLQGTILAKLEKFTEADQEFKAAVRIAPDAQSILSGYAWMLAEQFRFATHAQLLDARSMAARAVAALPSPGNYETLGWAEFRLHENDKALQDLRRAESLCVSTCRYSTDWPEIQFHLGEVYAAMQKKSEARKAFQAVLQYHQESPELSEDKYVRQAKASLGKT
jgi:tetratricopeptide (TPR) repeat protein